MGPDRGVHIAATVYSLLTSSWMQLAGLVKQTLLFAGLLNSFMLLFWTALDSTCNAQLPVGLGSVGMCSALHFINVYCVPPLFGRSCKCGIQDHAKLVSTQLNW